MREQALEIFNAAVAAVQPSQLLPRYLRVTGDGLWLHDRYFPFQEWENIYVIGAGKASAAMAWETEQILGDRIAQGVVVTKYDHALPLQRIKLIEAGHPVPDGNSLRAGQDILQVVQQAGEKDIIIALISGGASALLADLPPGVTINEVQQLFRLLLQCGATIEEMNAVRKHLSQIKGGQLSRAAYPATLVAFILSDVIGDPLHVIASGPTVPDPTTFADAYNVLQQYHLLPQIPDAIHQWLKNGRKGQPPETPKPGDPVFGTTTNYLVGTNRLALEAAAAKAKTLGYEPLIITDRLSGEAREKAAAFVQNLFKNLYRGNGPVCLLMGGETTVSIKGNGKGGRNQEFALAALCTWLKEGRDVDTMPIILSAGTDGTDGPTDAAGALIDAAMIDQVKQLQLKPEEALAQNDSYHFFQQAGGLVMTGATQTNVMDVVIALIPG